MTDAEQREAARKFANRWRKGGDEKQDCHKYWLQLLAVLGVSDSTEYIQFEKPVRLPEADGKIHTRYADGYISAVKVLIEQKGSAHKLDEKEPQSGGELLTPYEQAKRYNDNLPYEEKARWIITCNFLEIWVYDMNAIVPEPQKLQITDIQSKYPILNFLVKQDVKHLSHEMQVSIQAGDIVGQIYDAFLKQYGIPETPPKNETDSEREKREHKLRSLNALCVRLVFLFYAEDSGIFEREQFHDYLEPIPAPLCRKALMDLFRVLDMPDSERKQDEYLEDSLAAFPYVNGGLFADENIIIPQITEEIKTVLLEQASEGFDWKDISPTIFGAVFESTLNPETRRAGGMHYTSVENIHRVIDPLFLNDLKEEFKEICSIQQPRIKRRKLEIFQQKLSSIVCLDPAAGSGNFLTESYISLRRLENQVIKEITDGQLSFAQSSQGLIKVSIQQFYGIEINDFAVTVAKTALWIAESQMLEETKALIYGFQQDFLPLKTYVNITEGNALQLDWNQVLDKNKLTYIMGNPPFVGQSLRNSKQADDMIAIWGKGEIETKLDYVICWYKKALDFINSADHKISVAYVSTNSICQGESVPTFWKKMVDNGATIEFAYRSFVWSSEANSKAAVHCVIVGFSNVPSLKPQIFDGDNIISAKHINPYLLDAPDIWITNRINKPQNGLPKMTTGSPPTDDGALTLTVEEKDKLITKYPILKKYIKPFIGAREFLHDKVGSYSRYCLWFKNGNPSEYANIPELRERFARVKALRIKSKADRINKMAEYPYLFCQIRQPESSYLVFPRHSSQARRYIPIGFESSDVIAGDACSIIPNVTLYEFAVLTSNIHNAWMRIVCGRLKSDFRYSPSVYNNFPWPEPTESQKQKIEQTAQGILDARALYPDSSLADLYDPLTMPPELRKAHTKNDVAVMQAYGFSTKMSEADCVAALMKMYQRLTDGIESK